MIFFDVVIVFVFLISRWYVVIEITVMYVCDHVIVILLGVTTATTGWKSHIKDSFLTN